MLYLDDIKVEFESQEFKGTHIGISPKKDKSILFLESIRSTQTVRCPYCGGSVYIYENGQVKLKDIPIWRGTTHIWNFFIHRYQCNCCHETFTEEIPFKYPGTRITYRAITIYSARSSRPCCLLCHERGNVQTLWIDRLPTSSRRMDKMVSGDERKWDSHIGTVCSSKRKTAPWLSDPCHLLNQHRQARRLQQQDQGR